MKTKHCFTSPGLSILLLAGSITTNAQQTVLADTTSAKTITVTDSAKNLNAAGLIFEKTEIEASVDIGL